MRRFRSLLLLPLFCRAGARLQRGRRRLAVSAVLVVSGCLLVVLLVGVARASGSADVAQGPFIGTWQAIDLGDGSHLTLTALQFRCHLLQTNAELGPRVVYLMQADGTVLLRDGRRIYACPAGGAPHDRYAGPAAFWVGLAQKTAPRKAALDSVRYAQSVRRAGAPRPAHATSHRL